MNVKAKIDVLDFIIHVLCEHERKLDSLVGRLETISQELDYWIKRQKYDSISIRTQEFLTELLGDPISQSSD